MTKMALIKWLSIAWVAASVVLVALFAMDGLSKATFQWSFAGGFIAYAVVATLINNIDFSIFQKADERDAKGPEED